MIIQLTLSTETYNWFAVFLTILTMLIAVVSMMVSIYQAKITQDIAQQSLRISNFGFKKELTPDIIVRLSLDINPRDNSYKHVFTFVNRSRGPAKIKNIFFTRTVSKLKEKSGKEIEFDFELKFNNAKSFIVELNAVTLTAINADLLATGNLSDFRVREYLKQLAISYFMFVDIGVEFDDAIGTTYQSNLRYNKDEKMFSGMAKEISGPI